MENAFLVYREHSYNLHAIVIHDGFAQSGHYYCFIYDRASKNWWRFNDHTV